MRGLAAVVGFLVFVELASGILQGYYTPIFSDAEVVGLTIAEFFPRQVMHLQQILQGFPLISQH